MLSPWFSLFGKYLKLLFVVTAAICSSCSKTDNAERINTGAVEATVVESQYSTFIRKPAGPPAIKTDMLDHHGSPISVACNTCHTTRPANHELKMGTELLQFHQGIKGAHGNLNCVSCHHPEEGYQSLRLANGKALPYTEVMQLCAQCHGPQYRDYQHGAHGGMNGFWDLSRGNRYRNNCIDCHNPHAPKFPTLQPAPGPINPHPSKPGGKQGAGHE